MDSSRWHEMLEEPDELLMELVKTWRPMLTKMLLFKAQCHIEPQLKRVDLMVSDIYQLSQTLERTLVTITDMDALMNILKNPSAFLLDVFAIFRPLLINVLLAKLRPGVELWLIKHELEWSDVRPIFKEDLQSTNSLSMFTTKGQAALEDPMTFLQKHAAHSKPLIVKVFFARLQPHLEKWLAENGLEV